MRFFDPPIFRYELLSNLQSFLLLMCVFVSLQLAATLRRFILGTSPYAPKRLCHSIALLRLGASYPTALAVLLHLCTAALKSDSIVGGGVGGGRDTFHSSSSSSSSSSVDFSKQAHLAYLGSASRSNGMRSFDAGRSSGGIMGSSKKFQAPGKVHRIGGLRVSNSAFQRTKVAVALAHVLAALGSAAWPVGRPRAIGVELPLPSTEGCWWAPFAPKPRKRPYSRSAQPPKPLEPASSAAAAASAAAVPYPGVPSRTRRGRYLLDTEESNAERNDGSGSSSNHRVREVEGSHSGNKGNEGSGDGTSSSSSGSSSSIMSSAEDVESNSKVGGRREALSAYGLLSGSGTGSSSSSSSGGATSTMSFSDRLAGIGGGFLDFSSAGGFSSNSGSGGDGSGGSGGGSSKNYALRDLVSGGKAYDRGPAFNCFGQDQNLPGQLPAFGYATPSLWAQYAHGIFCAYWYGASPFSSSSALSLSSSSLTSKPMSARRRCLQCSLLQALALVYLACMAWSSVCLGMEGFATWIIAIGCNRFAWRLAGATASKSFLAQCCCPWLPPLVAAMKGVNWLQRNNHPNASAAKSQDRLSLFTDEGNNINSSHHGSDAEVETTSAVPAGLVSAPASPESASFVASKSSHSEPNATSLRAQLERSSHAVQQDNASSSSSTFFDISSSFDASGGNHDSTTASDVNHSADGNNHNSSNSSSVLSLGRPAKLLSRFSANSLATLPLSALTRGLSDGLSKGSLVRESFNDLIAMACTGAGGSVDGEFDLQAHTASSTEASGSHGSGSGTNGGGSGSAAHSHSGVPGSPASLKWQHDRRARRNRLAQTIGTRRSTPSGFGLGLTPRHASHASFSASSSSLDPPTSFTGGGSSSFSSNLGGGRSASSSTNRGGASSGRYRKTSDDFEDGGINGGSMDGVYSKSSSRGSEELYDDFDDQFDLYANGGYASNEFFVGLGGENQYEEGEEDEVDDDEENFSAHCGDSFDGSGSYDDDGGGVGVDTGMYSLPPPPPPLANSSPSPQQGSTAAAAAVAASSGTSPSSSSSHQRKGTSGSVECDDLETLGLFGPSYTAMMAQESPLMPVRGRKTALAAAAADSKVLRGTAIDHGNQSHSNSSRIRGALKRP